VIDLKGARLVAARDIREQARGRALWISLAITVVAVVLVVVLPKVLASGPPTYRIGLVSTAVSSATPALAATSVPSTETLRQSIEAAVTSTGAKAKVVAVSGRDDAAARLRQGGDAHLDIAVVTGGDGDRVLVDRAFPAGSTERKALAADSIARAVSIANAVAAGDVSPATAQALTNPTPLPIDHLRPAPAPAGKRVVALVGAIVFYLLVLRYGFGLLMGVVQEKSTRVIEVVLATTRPIDLLAGKVLGSAVMVFAQAAVLAAAALISAQAVGSDILKTSGASAIAVAFVWVVIGFLLYSALFAAAGSLASKAEDAQSVSLPLQIPLFIGYFSSFTVLGSGSAGTFITVLAYIPFTAPMSMPVLAATGGAEPWQIAVSMLITVAAILATMRLAAVLFSRSILRTGGRLKARQVLAEARRSAV
jgi:ABC-2 type transport system permease protein